VVAGAYLELAAHNNRLRDARIAPGRAQAGRGQQQPGSENTEDEHLATVVMATARRATILSSNALAFDHSCEWPSAWSDGATALVRHQTR